MRSIHDDRKRHGLRHGAATGAGARSIHGGAGPIDLAGGTIDIWPLYLFHDGAPTVNAAETDPDFAPVATN